MYVWIVKNIDRIDTLVVCATLWKAVSMLPTSPLDPTPTPVCHGSDEYREYNCGGGVWLITKVPVLV